MLLPNVGPARPPRTMGSDPRSHAAEDPALRAVLVGMLREIDVRQAASPEVVTQGWASPRNVKVPWHRPKE